MNPRDLLDPAHLALVSDFNLLARTAADGFFAGLHRSLSHGQGTEFFQYKSYSPGEDLKFVDWKVYAKREELHTKTFEQETNTTCYLVVDTSASLGYQGTRAACSKLRYACMVAATLAYLANRQGDGVGLVAYGETVEEWLEPRFGSAHLQRILHALARLEASGPTGHRGAWGALTRRLPGRGMVVFLSDMLEAEDTLPDLLKFGQTSKYDCLALQLLDPDEIDLPFKEATQFEDLENTRRVPTAPDTIRAGYEASMAAYLETLRGRLIRSGADHLQVTTDTSLGLALGHYLHHRERLR